MRPTGGMVYGPHARRASSDAPPSAPHTRRPSPAPAASDAPDAPSGFGALTRAWMRAMTPSAWVSVHEEPHPITARAVRWAPVVAPALVGGLLLTLALALVAHGRSVYAPLPVPAVIPALFAAYLVGGALLGLALHFAPNGVVWALAFFGGPPLLALATLTILYGLPGGLLLCSALAALLLVYSVWRRVGVRAGSVEVTLLLGEWYRVLPPGSNILLPGERVITTLRTTPRAFTTATQRVTLAPNRIAQARATVSYLVNPREAWRTAGVRATWEEELRQRISASVRGSLTEWRTTPDGDVAERGSVASRALDETSGWARSVGVRILSVRTHDIAIGAPDELGPQQPAEATGATAAHATPPVKRASAAPRARATPSPGATDVLPIASPAAAPARMDERPSPEALEDLYEAVRNRQITDTQVIREIAGHFAALARTPSASAAALPFDSIAAARLLDEYAEALDSAQAPPPSRARRSV